MMATAMIKGIRWAGDAEAMAQMIAASAGKAREASASGVRIGDNAPAVAAGCAIFALFRPFVRLQSMSTFNTRAAANVVRCRLIYLQQIFFTRSSFV
jgi:hypothetical protein